MKKFENGQDGRLESHPLPTSFILSMKNLRENLELIWDTSTSWNKTGKRGLSEGQCYVTSLLVQNYLEEKYLKKIIIIGIDFLMEKNLI